MHGQVAMRTFYRACIWLPIAVPLIIVALFNALGRNIVDVLLAEVLFYSLLYGGLPYAILAAWATWWVGGRSEAEIRWLMFRAPLLMVALFVPLALIIGVVLGIVRPWVGVAVVGSVIILVLGYAYVALVVLLKRALTPRA